MPPNGALTGLKRFVRFAHAVAVTHERTHIPPDKYEVNVVSPALDPLHNARHQQRDEVLGALRERGLMVLLDLRNGRDGGDNDLFTEIAVFHKSSFGQVYYLTHAKRIHFTSARLCEN